MPIFISVITVCYNALDDLKKTCESLLEQSLVDIEYIVVDGASNDGTVEFLKECDTLFPEERFLWKSEPDHGVYDAMNKGIDLATGEWVIFMNAGDTFADSTILAKMNSFLRNAASEIGVVYGDTCEVYQWGNMFLTDDEDSSRNPTMPFCHQSAFTRCTWLKQFHFNLRYKIIADHDFYYQLRQKKVSFLHCPLVISRFEAQNGLSSKSPLLIQLEHAHIHGMDQHWHWPLRYLYIMIRSGCVQPLKDILPKKLVYAIMRFRRRHMLADTQRS